MRLRELIGALSVVLVGVAAEAQETPDAQIARGLELRRAGHDDEAVRVFRSVWSASHEARALAQMALAEQALGSWVEAERDLDAAMEASADPWIRSHREPLADSMQAIRQHVARLDVRCDVTGAEVLVGGAVVGTVPLAQPIHVPAGTVEFTVRAAGRTAVTRSIVATPGSLLRETVALAPATTASTPVVAAPTPTPTPAPPLPVRAAEPTPRTPPPSSTQRILGITALALGGAGLVVGAALTGLNAGAGSAGTNATASSDDPYGSWFRYQQANPSVTNTDTLCTMAQNDPRADLGTVRDLCSRVAGERLGAIVSFVVGGALVATGTALMLTAPSHSVERIASAVRISPWLTAGHAGASVSVRW